MIWSCKGRFHWIALFVVFGGLCSSSSKNDHFRSNFKSTIGGSAKHQIEFQKKYTYSRPRGDFGTFFSTQQLKLKWNFTQTHSRQKNGKMVQLVPQLPKKLSQFSLWQSIQKYNVKHKFYASLKCTWCWIFILLCIWQKR